MNGILNTKHFFTEYKGHAVKLSASITASIPEDSQIKLIAVGGDGTIQEVLSGVKDISRVIFGYIPTDPETISAAV